MSASADAIRTAVHRSGLNTLTGMQQRMFSYWFNSFIYNQIWEDPRVDIEALEINESSRVFTIASGGCNVLNYLTANPEAILAVDLNPYHMSLTRLKISALELLPSHEDFYQFFGFVDAPANIDLYEAWIKPGIGDSLDGFWQGRDWRRRKRIEYFSSRFYQKTRFGIFLKLLHQLGKRAGLEPELLLQSRSLEEQRDIYEQHISPFFDHFLVKAIGHLPFSVFSLGIPPQQYAAMKKNGNLVEQYRERLRHLACDFPINDNYFAWQAFSQSYDHDNRQAIPDYLKLEHYADLKHRVNLIDTQLASLTECLQQQSENSLDRFVFLDAMDWMSDDGIRRLWAEVLRTGRHGTRIIFRTAAAESPVEHALDEKLAAQFVYEKELSAEFYEQDRSAIYGGFHLYRML